MTARPSPDPDATVNGWCHWHRGPSETAVLIDTVGSASGPAIPRYACAPCREQRPLIPYDERPRADSRPAAPPA